MNTPGRPGAISAGRTAPAGAAAVGRPGPHRRRGDRPSARDPGADHAGARLAVRARTSGLLATDVNHALTADRSVVVSWLNRGTLHLVLAEDYWWLHQLTTPQLATGNARRLAQEGVRRRCRPGGRAEEIITEFEKV